MKYERNEFLKLSAFGAIGACLTPTELFSQSKNDFKLSGKTKSPKEVIIIGGGVAGLPTAYELKKMGHSPIILEGQSRIGGRVYTNRNFSDGLYTEFGATRVPLEHKLTQHYIKELELELEPFFPSKGAYVKLWNGKEYHEDNSTLLRKLGLDSNVNKTKQKIKARIYNKLKKDIESIGDIYNINWPSKSDVWKYDQLSAYELLKLHGFSDNAISYYNWTKDLSFFKERSALDYLRYELKKKEIKNSFYKVKGGMDNIPLGFAKFLKEEIRYEAKVVKIDHNDKGVKVTYTSSGGNYTITGDYVVSAVPFTVLRNIEIVPKLSDKKSQAIDQLYMRPVVRTDLQFKKHFWEDTGHNGFGDLNDPARVWHLTQGQKGKRGCLTIYQNDSQAYRISAMSKANQVESGIGQIEQLYTGARKYLENVSIHDWYKDPWAKGAYTSFKVGQMSEIHPYLANSEGRIHFAGEHTSQWMGWMQAAFQSTHRVVKEIEDNVLKN